MKGSLSCIAALGCLVAWWSLLSATAPARYLEARTIGAGMEWRFRPLVLDLDRDGHPDLVATARLADNPLRIWLGDGRGAFTEVRPTWTDTGYAALAAGDVNRDGLPDIVAASHFGAVQTLLSDGEGGFTEKTSRHDDGYVAAQLADLNGDGLLDLVLLGYQKAGIEVYRGDGTGNWSLQRTLPERQPDRTMPGRDVLVADLDHDDHVDLVAAFQRWGIYVYYGDGRGGFTGGPTSLRSPAQIPESLAVGDVNRDGHPDIAVNGNVGGPDQANGPDVYLGNGRRGWSASSIGLKALKRARGGMALADLDRDGHLDIVAAGGVTGDIRDGFGLFWFAGDGSGGWQLVQESGLPTKGLPVIHSVTLADLDHDGFLEIVALGGGRDGRIAIWKATIVKRARRPG